MGGLAGLLDRERAPRRDLLEAMSARLARRGPDGAGQWLRAPIALGHRRRVGKRGSPVEPVRADGLVVMIDGWIDDPAALGRRLGIRRPQADAELLLAAWRRWGPAAVERVGGPYAAVVWEEAEERLHLVRDRVGTRPLYWTRQGGQLAFASELPALLELPWVSRELAREHLAEYLSFRTVHAPRTLVGDVYQLEPGTRLEIHAAGVEAHSYWRPGYAPPGTPRPDEDDLVSGLQAAVERAVARQLPAGVRAGLYLSGGLGSTAIAAAARRFERTLPTFTASFTDDLNPEAPFAGRVAQLLGLDHHEVVVGSRELAGALDAAVDALGHPVGNPAVVLELLLARAAAEHVDVVLSGHGSDELFGGRMLDEMARDLRRRASWARLPAGLRNPLRNALSRVGRGRRLESVEPNYGLRRGMGGARLFEPDDRQQLLVDPDLVRPEVRREVLAPFYAGLDTDPVNAVLHAYLRSWLGDERLPRADRTAGAAGIAARFPLLDQEIVSMAMALPGGVKVRRLGGSLHTRWPLKATLSGVLPGPLLNRPKRTMPAPLGTWLAGPGRLLLEERNRRLLEERRELFATGALEQLRAEVATEPQAAMKLWALFLLDAWMRRFDIR